MSKVDVEYLNLINDILENGVDKDTRSGKVKSVFGRMLRFNLKEGLPILTTKKMFSRGCIHELLWFLKGDTNIKYLVENNVHIWDDDAYRHYLNLIDNHNANVKEFGKTCLHYNSIIEPVSKEEFLEKVLAREKVNLIKKYEYFYMSYVPNQFMIEYTYGDLGKIYGSQWRGFGTTKVDQIAKIIDTLKTNPDDRRMLCIAYNPDVADNVALPPCHVMFQFYTKVNKDGERELSLLWTQRSVDVGLGLPFNILSYAILTYMIAQVCDMEVGELICSLGDTHIYENQLEGIYEQLSRNPNEFNAPTLNLNKDIKNINDFIIDDFKIENYQSYPKINLPLSVG